MATTPITYAELNDLQINYEKNKLPLLEDGIKKPDTKMVWFEKNSHLQKLLNDLLNDPTATGLLVCFTAYEKTPTGGFPQDPADVERLSVALAATEDKDGTYGLHSSIEAVNHGELNP